MQDTIKRLIFFDALPTTLQEKIKTFIRRFRRKGRRGPLIGFGMANVSLAHIPIGVYFSGGKGQLYQIQQWLRQFSTLDEQQKMVIVTRKVVAYEWLRKNTDFIVVHCRTMDDVISFYESNDLKCILYVNHAMNNFQSLINGKALHVHINHGESDKTSTITNQSKAYDYILISGQAAYDKYHLNLIKKEMSKFIKIGRPQVDNIEQIPAFETAKKVVLYAPTWEGTHESMNFSSLNDHGSTIVERLLESDEYFLVYKPHPNSGSRDARLRNINNTIIEDITASENGLVVLEGDINSLYPHVSIAIFDNSAVAIDYLIVDKPMIMTDMFHRIEGRLDKPTITGAARMLSDDEADTITEVIRVELEQDTVQERRREISKYFLGEYDYTKSESTEMFVSTVLEIIKERDKLITDLDALHQEKA